VGLNRLLLDTANTVAGFDTDLDVSSISPGGTPRVLDEVVILASFSAESDGENTMIKLGTTSGSSDDSSLVRLEGGLVSLDGYGDGSLNEGGL